MCGCGCGLENLAVGGTMSATRNLYSSSDVLSKLSVHSNLISYPPTASTSIEWTTLFDFIPDGSTHSASGAGSSCAAHWWTVLFARLGMISGPRRSSSTAVRDVNAWLPAASSHTYPTWNSDAVPGRVEPSATPAGYMIVTGSAPSSGSPQTAPRSTYGIPSPWLILTSPSSRTTGCPSEMSGSSSVMMNVRGMTTLLMMHS